MGREDYGFGVLRKRSRYLHGKGKHIKPRYYSGGYHSHLLAVAERDVVGDRRGNSIRSHVRRNHGHVTGCLRSCSHEAQLDNNVSDNTCIAYTIFRAQSGILTDRI